MVKNGSYYDVVTLDTTGQPLVNHYVTYWTPKTTKNDFLGFFGPLIQFKSFNSTANDLKGFLFWSSTIVHHSRMWKGSVCDFLSFNSVVNVNAVGPIKISLVL